MVCEICAKSIDQNWGDSVTFLCEACANSDKGKALLANHAHLSAREKPGDDAQGIELNTAQSMEWEESYKKWGESIQNSIGCLAWVGFLIWIVLVAFGDRFEATEAKRNQLMGPMQTVRNEIAKSFPGSEFRLESRFGENLRLYIPRKTFETVPYPDRPKIVARIGKAWCSQIRQKYLLPGFSVRDIQSADKLASYNCVLPKPW